MIHEISDQKFLFKTSGFCRTYPLCKLENAPRCPSYLTPLALSLQYQYLSILSWFAYVPFWLGMRGRKDKGVFGYGCLFGAVSSSSFLFFETSIGSILTLLASSAVFECGVCFREKCTFIWPSLK